jgi:predicted O-methyltransferase YrrM
VFRQARLAASLVVRDPRLLSEYARWAIQGRLHHVPEPSGCDDSDVLALDDCLALVEAEFGVWGEGPSLARVREWSFDQRARIGGGATMAGDTLLGRLVYEVARAARPDTIVETGVATGVTSAHLLAALEDNGHGVLHSVDLPPSDMVIAGHVGAAIPSDLRHRWVYHWGVSRRVLPKLLDNVQGGLMFVHDSDHSYQNMSWEIRSAWRAMSPGGVIICDDVHLNSAFLDSAGELGAHPHLVGQAEKGGITGLLIRSYPGRVSSAAGTGYPG